ncbi:MAG: ribonuclease HII [Anaerolineae bacterium]
MASTRGPGLEEEWGWLEEGYRLVAGVDEAGRGAWAGPVYAAAVILPLERPGLHDALGGVADSKQLSPGRREALLPVIHAVALSVGVGAATAAEIDALGIVPATRLAMRRAIAALSPAPEALLLDYVTLPQVKLPQRALPKADQHCLSVAAASIVAKVSRDRWMVELEARCPGYGFARHKGYGTAAHRAALERLGASRFHRTSWAPLQALASREKS